jgi:LmbE family N-acetylglucosaminyl deacetylase
MKICLYISPHLDDAALSCAGAMLGRVDAGERVVVCTIFTRSGSRHQDQQRHAEDLRALEPAGIEALHLGFLDAPKREGLRPSFESLLLSASRPNLEVIREIEHAIETVVARLNPDEIYLPLGVGGHVDHRLVFAARPEKARFYLERPYAFVPVLRALRRLELEGGAARGPDSAQQFLREIDSGSCGALLLEDERPRCAEVVARRMKSRFPQSGVRVALRRHWEPASSLPRAVKLIDAYESQVRWMFGEAGAGPHYRRHVARGDRWFEEEAHLFSAPRENLDGRAGRARRRSP